MEPILDYIYRTMVIAILAGFIAVFYMDLRRVRKERDQLRREIDRGSVGIPLQDASRQS